MLDKVLKVVDADKNRKETVQQQEYKLVGSQRRIPGLKLWSYDPVKDEVELVKEKREAVVKLDGTTALKSKVTYNPKLIYFQALRYETALKKASKYKVEAMRSLRTSIAEELKRRESKQY